MTGHRANAVPCPTCGAPMQCSRYLAVVDMPDSAGQPHVSIWIECTARCQQNDKIAVVPLREFADIPF